MNKLSSSGRSSCSSSAYLDVEDTPLHIRNSSTSASNIAVPGSSNGNGVRTTAHVLTRCRPESADKVKPRKSTSQSNLISEDQPNLTRNQPHHRPRLDLHVAPNHRFVSRFLYKSRMLNSLTNKTQPHHTGIVRNCNVSIGCQLQHSTSKSITRWQGSFE